MTKKDILPSVTKVVVQMSGGIESTALFVYALKRFGRENVFPIGFNDESSEWLYKNRPAVMSILTEYRMHRSFYECPAPHFERFEFRPDAVYDDAGFIPGFKMIINTISLAYATSVGAQAVLIGNMLDNVYPDETYLSLVETESTYNRMTPPNFKLPDVGFATPFASMSKGDVIAYAMKDLRMPSRVMAMTVSCGDDRVFGGYNCGECSWCLKRKAGFAESGISDPTRYVLGG